MSTASFVDRLKANETVLREVNKHISNPVLFWTSETTIIFTGVWRPTGHTVAMKLFPGDATKSSTFADKVVKLARHPNILHCFDIGTLDYGEFPVRYAVMEMCPLRDVEHLKSVCQRLTPMRLSALEMSSLRSDLAKAMEFLHSIQFSDMSFNDDCVFLAPVEPNRMGFRGRWLFKLSLCPHAITGYRPGCGQPCTDQHHRFNDCVAISKLAWSIEHNNNKDDSDTTPTIPRCPLPNYLEVLHGQSSTNPEYYSLVQRTLREIPTTACPVRYVGHTPDYNQIPRATSDIATHAFQFWVAIITATYPEYKPQDPVVETITWWDFLTGVVYLATLVHCSIQMTHVVDLLRPYLAPTGSSVTLDNFMKTVALFGEFYNPVHLHDIKRNFVSLHDAPWFHMDPDQIIKDIDIIQLKPTTTATITTEDGDNIMDSPLSSNFVEAVFPYQPSMLDKSGPWSSMWDCPYMAIIKTPSSSPSLLPLHKTIHIARCYNGAFHVKINNGQFLTKQTIVDLVEEINHTLSKHFA